MPPLWLCTGAGEWPRACEFGFMAPSSPGDDDLAGAAELKSVVCVFLLLVGSECSKW